MRPSIISNNRFWTTEKLNSEATSFSITRSSSGAFYIFHLTQSDEWVAVPLSPTSSYVVTAKTKEELQNTILRL